MLNPVDVFLVTSRAMAALGDVLRFTYATVQKSESWRHHKKSAYTPLAFRNCNRRRPHFHRRMDAPRHRNRNHQKG